jgi:hypothetical protein
MSFHRAILLFFLLYYSTCTAQSSPDNIIDCTKNSRITRATTASDVIKMFGGSNTINGQIQVGEGKTDPGTIVFPGNPKKRLEITWGKRTKQQPMIVRIASEDSVWHTFGGIGTGMSLKEIEKINGKPFALTGFGWDYDGAVTSWQKGKIGRSENGCRILLRFRPSQSDALQKKQALKQVQGDHAFLSSQPAMRAVNPRVFRMAIAFWNP